MERVEYRDIESGKIADLIKERKSFVVAGLNGRLSSAVNEVERIIESRGLRCRVYTVGRVASVGASLFGGVTGILGIGSAIGIAAHNIATYDPDYEIGKHLVDNKLTVEYKK